MANGRTKLTLRRLIGISSMEKSRVTKANTSMLTSKNGKIRQAGGALLFKVILRLILKKLILNLQNFQISMVRLVLQCRK
jgi:hypothetical protein